VRGNPQALFGKRPTEKDPAKGTSPAVDFTLRGPRCSNAPGLPGRRASCWSLGYRCVSLTRTRRTESSHAARSISGVLQGLVGESVSRPTAWPAGFCPFPVFS
jgi:hypothetical protein